MTNFSIGVSTNRAGAMLPKYATDGSAGADLHACLTVPMTLEPGEWKLIPTGLVFDTPAAVEVQVRPRSGLANKFGVTVLNSPGTIDSDYRGEVMVMLINLGDEDFVINHGDRIAQAVVAPAPQVPFYTVDGAVSETTRGQGGFGSTGI